MLAARVEYIAPWWVVWLHSVPHVGLRLQPVDSTFRPRDESYQEVSPRRPPTRRPKSPRHPFRPPSPPLSTGVQTPSPTLPAASSPLLPFPRESLAYGPPVWEPHGPGQLERWELSRPRDTGGKGAEAACGGAGRLSAEGEGSAARRRGICARTR